MSKVKLGVVLFQLGGPDTPAAVEPFLFNLFSDPDIIDFPGAFLARRPLARYLSRRRAAAVRGHYDAIGGQSPIRGLTEKQARKLEEALSPEFDARCWVAMRYWNPLTAEAVKWVRSASLDALILLPLYPQYSLATTQSSLNEWNRVYRPAPGAPTPIVIQDFHMHPLYIEALVERMNRTLERFEDAASVHLVFSAHGLPLRLIERGDPYQRQVQETVQAVMSRGGWRNPHSLSYQSRIGRQKWLEPPVSVTIKRLAAEGQKRLLVIPISFVTDHSETLYEINIEAREEAMEAGIEQFEMMPALDDAPGFIAALASLVRAKMGAPQQTPARAASRR